VREVRARVSIPIVGMGGVQSGRHAADLLAAGADIVGVGTESFRDPLAGARVADELALLSASGHAAPRAGVRHAAHLAPNG
jgi:dihydroorotate dehydrogenase (NAD+) catalytic subunit